MKKVTAFNGDYLLYFHPLTIVSNVIMRNGTNPLMFIGRVYNSMRSGTYPLMFIGRAYNSVHSSSKQVFNIVYKHKDSFQYGFI